MSDLRDLGSFYADVISVDPLDPSGAASAAYRLKTLAPALPFPVDGARLIPSNNNDVWRVNAGYLRVSWRGDRSRLAREAVLFNAIKDSVPVPQILDYGGDNRVAWSLSAPVPGVPLDDLCTLPEPAGTRGLAREAAGLLRTLHACPVPDEFAGMLTSAEEDPLRRAGSEADPDLERRLWRYAIAYTFAHIIYWPPDRAETDGLDATHPMHTLRRLIDAPLPFPAGD